MESHNYGVQTFDKYSWYQVLGHIENCTFETNAAIAQLNIRLNTKLQVLAIILMLKWTTSANQMDFMKSWTIEQYCAGIGDDFDVKIN